MSIQQQRLILITLFLVVFAGYQGHLWNNPTFSCEALREDPIYELNFNVYTDTTATSRFMLWLDTHYETRPVDFRRYVAWEKGRLEYKTHFKEA